MEGEEEGAERAGRRLRLRLERKSGSERERLEGGYDWLCLEQETRNARRGQKHGYQCLGIRTQQGRDGGRERPGRERVGVSSERAVREH